MSNTTSPTLLPISSFSRSTLFLINFSSGASASFAYSLIIPRLSNTNDELNYIFRFVNNIVTGQTFNIIFGNTLITSDGNAITAGINYPFTPFNSLNIIYNESNQTLYQV